MPYRITCNSLSRSEQFPFCSLDLSGYINKFRGISKSKSPNSSAEHRLKGSCPKQNTFLLCFLFCFGIFCFTSLSFLKACLIFLFFSFVLFFEKERQMEVKRERGQRQRAENIKLGGQGAGQDMEGVGRKEKMVQIQKY